MAIINRRYRGLIAAHWCAGMAGQSTVNLASERAEPSSATTMLMVSHPPTLARFR
jgi:hypothetical protein